MRHFPLAQPALRRARALALGACGLRPAPFPLHAPARRGRTHPVGVNS
jgi:hypothetical protein